MIRSVSLLACLGVVVPVTVAAGQPTPADAPDAAELTSLGEPDWTIRFEPVAYFAATTGDMKLPSTGSTGTTIELSDLNLDSPRLSPKGRFIASRGLWRFTVGGLGLAMSDRGATMPFGGRVGGAPFRTGDRLVSDLSFESFELNAAYRVYHRHSKPGGPVDVDVRGDLLFGLRMYHIDTSTAVLPVIAPAPGTTLSAGADELFAEPIVGGRLEFGFGRTFGIDVEMTAGAFSAGDRSSASFSIEPGFVYRPIPQAGLRIGYRFMFMDLSSGNGAGEFNWSGAVAGLYWGAQLTF